MFSVTKEFSFDAAHRLINGYEGKCRNIHGHTWRVRFTIAGARGLNQYGFVRDFSDFKPLKTFIDDVLDHAMLVSQDDEEMLMFLKAKEQKHFAMGANPTSEHLAQFLYVLAHQRGVPVTSVEIDETCTCTARYYGVGHV